MSDDDATTHAGWGEVVDESRHHVLALTDAGWGVWDRTGASDEPLALFPPDDRGFDLASDYFARANRAARGRGRSWLAALQWTAFLAGCVWIATTVIMQIWFYALETSFFGMELPRVLVWLQALNSIAYPVFLVAVGAYVLLWLKGHGEAERDRSDGHPRAETRPG